MQPSNSFATVIGYRGCCSSTRLQMYCCSNSTSSNVGSFTFPDGVVRSSNYWNADIDRFSWSSSYSGCIELDFSYYYYYSFSLSSSYDGVYTCTIPDSAGNSLQEYIGLYDESFSSKYYSLFSDYSQILLYLILQHLFRSTNYSIVQLPMALLFCIVERATPHLPSSGGTRTTLYLILMPAPMICLL